MEIKTIATGSTGNAYKISSADTSILIEAGIPIRKIQGGLNFGLSEIEFCLISHAHL